MPDKKIVISKSSSKRRGTKTQEVVYITEKGKNKKGKIIHTSRTVHEPI